MKRPTGSAARPAYHSAASSAERPTSRSSDVESTIASLASGSADYGVTQAMELAPKEFVFDDVSDCNFELIESFRRSMTEEDLLQECWHILDSLLAAQPEQSPSLLSIVRAEWRRERLACIIAVLHGLLVLYCV